MLRLAGVGVTETLSYAQPAGPSEGGKKRLTIAWNAVET